MNMGDYIYYRDSMYEYILKITRHVDIIRDSDIQIKILKCSKDDFSDRLYTWGIASFIMDCKEMRIITEAEALAMAL